MIKRDITYEDLDDNMVTKTFWFNLRADELFELEASFGRKGLAESLQALVDAEDTDTMTKEIKRIILTTYGVREGDEFIKNDEVRQKFINTGAYSALFMEFLTNNNSLAEFVNGVMPKNLPKLEAPDTPTLAPPAPMDVARVTEEQKQMGQNIIEGNVANG